MRDTHPILIRLANRAGALRSALAPERVRLLICFPLPLLSPGVGLLAAAFPPLVGASLVSQHLLTAAVTHLFIFSQISTPRQVPRSRHPPLCTFEI